MPPLNKISRTLYEDVIGNAPRRRAVAFAIYMKNCCPTSVVKDWSYKKLARITGLNPKTCKKYVGILREMKLARITSNKGHNYLFFKKLKEPKKKNRWNVGYHSPKYKDVVLGRYTTDSIKIIETHLRALCICEVQRRKDYARQSISTTQDPKNLKEFKRARKVCRARGWESFSDNGISYKYINSRLHCSPNTTSATIKYGEDIGLYTVTRSVRRSIFYRKGEARLAAKYIDERYSWYTNDTIYYQPANIYKLTVSE